MAVMPSERTSWLQRIVISQYNVGSSANHFNAHEKRDGARPWYVKPC